MSQCNFPESSVDHFTLFHIFTNATVQCILRKMWTFLIHIISVTKYWHLDIHLLGRTCCSLLKNLIVLHYKPMVHIALINSQQLGEIFVLIMFY